MEPLFSNGLSLANLTMSSSILIDSWDAISKHQGNKPVKIIKDHPDYNIIAIVSSPATTSNLPKERPLVPIKENSDFKFLCSDTLPSLSINEAAVSLFHSLRGNFLQLQEEVKTSSDPEAPTSYAAEIEEEPIPYIITGHGLNGSVASLFTLSLLNLLNTTKLKLLCITFGSPLLGDAAFQQAISRRPTWNSCFLHVVHKGDCVPRLYLDPPTTGQSPYEPFGTFLLCSESGGACFQAPESVIKLLKYEKPEAVAENQESRTVDYKNVINCLEKTHFRRNGSSFLGFGNGFYLSNLAVSYNLLTDSWNAISEYQGDGPVTIINDHPYYNIIAFVSSPVTTSNLQQERHLVPVSNIPEFQFLCSDNCPSLLIDKAALDLFNFLRGKLSQLQEEVKTSSEPEASTSSAEKNKKEEPIPYIITGRGLNGSVASLFTLLLLNTLDPTKFKLRCITFGSPLLGDTAFRQAVSRDPTWNSCFLHVVHKGDCVPRLFPDPRYKPFGKFLLFSELGGACFQDPESLIELVKNENPEAVVENQESRTFDYKNVIECHEKKLLERDYEAGITGQVAAVLLEQCQQQDEGISALIKSIVTHEKVVIKQQREELDPAELEEMKVYLTLLEWYISKCRGNGLGPGYYDSFKNARERRDNGVDKYKTYLTVYWEKVVEDAEKKPQLPSEPLRNRWLFGGTNYRRIVEPLDIAEYYRRGRKDYLTRGRSKHYERLEKWLEDYQKARKKGKKTQDKSEKAGQKGKETRDGPSKSNVVNVTEDSCFWARVEDAIRSCRLLDRARAGSSNDSEEKRPFDFEYYVMDLIKREKVSSDMFLEKSSYMQWWREYRQILNEKVEGSHSHHSELVNYMIEGRYENYGKPSQINSNVNPSDTSHLGPSTSGDPRG